MSLKPCANTAIQRFAREIELLLRVADSIHKLTGQCALGEKRSRVCYATGSYAEAIRVRRPVPRLDEGLPIDIGHDQSAAALGVGARRSATKSAMVKSISWPTALTIGIGGIENGARHDLFIEFP